MSDNINQTIGGGAEAAPKQEASIDLRPTLFIGVGGTGMEVLMRVRRRILNTLWGAQADALGLIVWLNFRLRSSFSST